MGDTLPKIKLAAVQAAPVYLDREASVEKACRLIREAGENGADFVGFPENFIPGHPVWYYYFPLTSPKSMDLAVRLFQNSVEIPSPTTDAICEAAAAANVFVVMGLTERRPNTTGTLYNTQLFIDRRGKIVGKHQKLVPTVGERHVHAGGSSRTQGVVMSEFGPVSGLICGENSNPMSVALLSAQYTRIHVANWPNHFIPGDFSMCASSLLASRNIAYACKCFVISACGVNSSEMIALLPTNESERAFLQNPAMTGGSVIINPNGTVIAGPLEGNQEGILYADVDLESCVRGRLIHDFGGHYNRADVFQLQIHDGPSSLLTNTGDTSVPVELREFRSLESTRPLASPTNPRAKLVAGPRAALEAGDADDADA
jgi:aliphatic nitrilase